ncbi:MAG TPA: hypothetical protein VN253_12165 [Kofleriaceae bacterium]|nr:hypothetical protein [Kofleriaceae bacterium]
MKWIVATLMTAAMYGAAVGARSTPADVAGDPPSIGTCRWECTTTGVMYSTAAKCSAACAGDCEEIC